MLEDDRYREYDFGTIKHDEETVLWKIRDYNWMDELALVLTAMLAEAC